MGALRGECVRRARLLDESHLIGSGWWESNPHSNFGKVVCYNYNTPAIGCCRASHMRANPMAVRTKDIALLQLFE